VSAYSNLIQLTRPANLVIVVVTMLVVRFAVFYSMMESASIGMEFGISWFQFFLLILVAVMLTAAGNVINDYFDQKVDRINKPDKVIIGKTVKRRVAIVLHQSLNIGAVLITMYVCFQNSYWWPMLFPIVIATLLWWYSPVLKKKAFVGNLAIAVCTAAVPLWAGVFEVHQLKKKYGDMLVMKDAFFEIIWLLLLALAAFAFLLTLVREAQKDLQDLKGDTDGGYHTLPIKYGVDAAKKYIYVLLSVYILLVAFFIYKIANVPNIGWIGAGICGLLLFVPSILSYFQTMRAANANDYGKASNYTKWMMLAGLVAFSLLSFLY
jgi:4-hydroxybenzoate polyprenyltransferase